MGLKKAAKTANTTPRKVDGEWFKAELKAAGKKGYELAKFLNIDVSAVTRIFNGERKMSIHEAALTSRFLGQPITVVIDRAGIPISDITPESSGFVQVLEMADVDGAVTKIKFKDKIFVPVPPDMPSTVQAVQYDTAMTAISYKDGWTLYYTPASSVSAEAFGRLCVVETEDGRKLLRIIEVSKIRGKYRLFTRTGVEDDPAPILSASPVIWIRT